MAAEQKAYITAHNISTNNIFLELGAHVGDGIQKAFNAGYNKVVGIELSVEYCNRINSKFQGINLELIQGDVELVLLDTLIKINEPCTIMVDAHYSGGDNARGLHDDPILQVLDIIEQHNIRTHTIMVDDMRAYERKTIENILLKINPSYKFIYEKGYVEEDVLVAYL